VQKKTKRWEIFPVRLKKGSWGEQWWPQTKRSVWGPAPVRQGPALLYHLAWAAGRFVVAALELGWTVNPPLEWINYIQILWLLLWILFLPYTWCHIAVSVWDYSYLVCFHQAGTHLRFLQCIKQPTGSVLWSWARAQLWETLCWRFDVLRYP
jgi:hypothetical protein